MTPFDAEWLRNALPWTADDQAACRIGLYGRPLPDTRALDDEWAWVQLAQRLRWHHSESETLRRLNEHRASERDARRARA